MTRTSPGRLVVRADAGRGVGRGHVERCCALGRAWIEVGGEAIVLVSPGDPGAVDRVRGQGLAGRPVESVGDDADLRATRRAAEGAAWLAVDGYRFPGPFVTMAGGAADRTLVVDDHGYGGAGSGADLVLDQNLGAGQEHYPTATGELLLGAAFALVPPGVPVDRSAGRYERPVENVLVCLGGAAGADELALVLDALPPVGQRPPVTVVGGAGLAPGPGAEDVRILGFVDDLSESLAIADVAVAAAGSVVWQICRSGLPALVVPMYDNQVPVAAALDAAGAARRVDPAVPGALSAALTDLLASSSTRRSLGEQARAVVDGRGPARAVATMRSLAIDLRPARPGDARLLWEWANDADVRQWSFDRRPIAWEDHQRWFAERLTDTSTRIYVAADAAGAWGLVRFACRGTSAEIGLSVAAEARGYGLAAPLIPRAYDGSSPTSPRWRRSSRDCARRTGALGPPSSSPASRPSMHPSPGPSTPTLGLVMPTPDPDRVIAVIQARMSSSRLPGKVLRPLGDLKVVDWVVRAARGATGVDGVVVATSTDRSDDLLVEHCRRAQVDTVRGSLDDVLDRFVAVLDARPAAGLVRLTADCPLLDPALVAAAVAVFRSGGCDYVSTVSPRTLPRGLDVEVVASGALRAAAAEARGTDRVHVTPFVRDHPERFPAAGLIMHPGAEDLRITLDTTQDARLLEEIVAVLGDGPHAWRTVVALLRKRPELVALNAGVRQKAASEG